MRLLFIKLGSIGDIVHTLPALAAVRRALPDAEISWVVERGAAEILRDNPILENTIVVDTKGLRRVPVSGETLSATRRQLRRLRASPFDLSIDFQGLLKSALIARLSRARRSVGFAREHLREPASRFLLSETFKVPQGTHVIRKNLALVSVALDIDVPVDANEFEFPLATKPEHVREAQEAAREARAPYAILNPGGNWATKLWDAQRYGQLADELWTRHALRSLVTYGPGETELAARVADASRLDAALPVSLSLKGFYELARRAQVYVGGDTGPTHLAIAAGAPVVGIFGPTEWWRNGSPRAEDIEVGRTDISCRVDCHRRKCSNWVCMEIEVARVVVAVSERLRRVRESKRAEVLTIA
ncbi:MAG: heptosyltransferase [Acidobacteriota bacterium]|nr:heptosyltransferase [Acidobacteriota bacterium]